MESHSHLVVFNIWRLVFQAMQCLKAAIQYSKHDISYIMLAKCYITEGNLEAAIDVYKNAVE